MRTLSKLEIFLNKLALEKLDEIQKIEYLYNYVRDQILFDFHPEVDDLDASDVFELGSGQCNNKTVLFYEMLTYLKIEARVHFSTIDKNIHRGLFPRLLLAIAPAEIGHSWVDVKVNGAWVQLDGFINDSELYKGAQIVNQQNGWKIGNSVAEGKCGSSIDFSLKEANFVQMEGIMTDLGTTKNPLAYLRSDKNPNIIHPFKLFVYKLALPFIRQRVVKVRALAN